MLLNIFIASMMMIITTVIHACGISLVVLAIESHKRNVSHRHSPTPAGKIVGD